MRAWVQCTAAETTASRARPRDRRRRGRSPGQRRRRLRVRLAHAVRRAVVERRLHRVEQRGPVLHKTR